MATLPETTIHFGIEGQGIIRDICLYNGGQRVCGVAEVFPYSMEEAQRLIRLANAALANDLEPEPTPA